MAQKICSMMMMNCKSLIGQKFGRLTVIERAENYISPSGSIRAQWICRCDCGSNDRVIVTTAHLKNGSIQSCGCLQKERIAQFNKDNKKKFNTYDLTGKYGIGISSNGQEFYFDLEDYDKIKNYCWWADQYGYLTDRNQNKIHRIIMDVTDGKIHVDHINHNTFDNRKCNLRLTTSSQNCMNQKIRIDNSSGVTGVTWDKHYNKWIARIGVQRKRIQLGRFDNFVDAVKARKDAERKYFGEYSYDASIDKNMEELY